MCCVYLVRRCVGMGSVAVRHMGVVRRMPVYCLYTKFMRYIDRQVFRHHAPSKLLAKATLKKTRTDYDINCLVVGHRHNAVPADTRIVSIRTRVTASPPFKSIPEHDRKVECSRLIPILFLVYRYDTDKHEMRSCGYNQNQTYVILSAMMSFFLPFAVMVYVYIKISRVIARRHTTLHGVNQPMRKVNFTLVGITASSVRA